MDVKIALTGFGNVGKGIAVLLRDQGDQYRKRYGINLVLTGVADRGGAAVDVNGLDPALLLQVKEEQGTVARVDGGEAGLAGAEFLKRAKASILIEAASTNFQDAEPGWTYIQEALERNMHLVLASKGGLVLHWKEIMDGAGKRDLGVYYSSTVGAPLPVLELTERMLVGTEIMGFEGLVNGTSNSILWTMEHGASYDEGVRLAQKAGIAEADPTLDVDGWDAAAKAVIIANAILGAELRISDVDRQGMREVTAQELQSARADGQRIKLVAGAERRPDGISAWVRPEARPDTDPLGSLDGGGMGIVFVTDSLGSVAATVQHTGGLATALTCLRDVVNLVRDRGPVSVSPP